ncbi:MAG: transporter substrate-binding domain-containing protein [Desulfobacteraceae bacterium]|nr:transporter substrate-binding domain-containing protein [Desulfobacteraceae bacterium]
MNLKKYLLVLLIIFLPFFVISETIAEEILWPYFHYPPLYNVEKGKISGYGVHVQKTLSNKMPGYDHKMIQTQPARLFEDLKNGEKYIAYGPVKTPEREKYLYYSLPCRLVFTDRVVMKRDAAKKYLISSMISLQKLAKDKNLVMGHSKGASYGNKLDGILKDNKKSLIQEILTGEEGELRQLKMIQDGRIDWMIWDPLALKTFLNNLDMHKDFKIYEIYEKEYAFIYAHIVVPKTSWGKQMIRKINTILKIVIPADEFYLGLSKCVPDELKPSFRKGYEEFIIQPAIEYETME